MNGESEECDLLGGEISEKSLDEDDESALLELEPSKCGTIASSPLSTVTKGKDSDPTETPNMIQTDKRVEYCATLRSDVFSADSDGYAHHTVCSSNHNSEVPNSEQVEKLVNGHHNIHDKLQQPSTSFQGINEPSNPASIETSPPTSPKQVRKTQAPVKLNGILDAVASPREADFTKNTLNPPEALLHSEPNLTDVENDVMPKTPSPSLKRPATPCVALDPEHAPPKKSRLDSLVDGLVSRVDSRCSSSSDPLDVDHNVLDASKDSTCDSQQSKSSSNVDMVTPTTEEVSNESDYLSAVAKYSESATNSTNIHNHSSCAPKPQCSDATRDTGETSSHENTDVVQVDEKVTKNSVAESLKALNVESASSEEYTTVEAKREVKMETNGACITSDPLKNMSDLKQEASAEEAKEKKHSPDYVVSLATAQSASSGDIALDSDVLGKTLQLSYKVK